MSSNSADVLIIGAGPGGATAAIRLAQRGHSVLLVDKSPFPRQDSSFGWLNARAIPMLKELGVSQRLYKSHAFTNITFFSNDFKKVARPRMEEAPGHLIDRVEFNNALVKTAVKAGVTLLDSSRVVDMRTRETAVIAGLEGGREVTARLLLLASGGDTQLLERLAFAPPTRHGQMWTAQIDLALEGRQYKGPPSVILVVGLDRQGSFAMACLTKQRVSVSINWLGEQEEALSKLAYVCSEMFSREVLPVDLSGRAADAVLLTSPASAALDMDTHTGKHTVLIGDAGGFVAAASNEGIYPAMWSAQIASEVISDALSEPQSQDALMTFDTKWRIAMADYLRPPNTDVQFLLPLIFSNQPMADRMAAALFSGENI